MDKASPHSIRRSILEISVPPGQDSHKWLDEIREEFLASMVPVIDKALTAIAPDDRLIRLERLEIDLGDVEGLDSEAICIRLEPLLKEEILNQTMSLSHPGTIVRDMGKGDSGTEFLWFMEFGVFPWFSHTSHIHDLESEISQLLQKDPHFVKHVEELFVGEKSLHRFINSVSGDFLRQSVLFFISNEWNSAAEFYRIIEMSSRSQGLDLTKDELTRIFAEHLFHLKYRHSRWDVTILLQNVLKVIHRKHVFREGEFETFLERLAEILASREETESLSKDNVWRFNKVLEDLMRPEGVSEMPDAVAQKEAFQHADPETDIDSFEARLNEKMPKRRRKQFGGEFLVDNAGLVLLYPFMRAMFETAGLVTDGQMTGHLAASKSVKMLHYAVWKDVVPLEQNLLLNKILCGLPEDYPVEVHTILSGDEMILVEDALQSLVREWQALKNTSPGGLREAFLQREGSLAYGDEHWHLLTGRTSRDILLDYLPFPISQIKLPWMNNRISVEW